jgi:hypothetical protein
MRISDNEIPDLAARFAAQSKSKVIKVYSELENDRKRRSTKKNKQKEEELVLIVISLLRNINV